MAFTPNPSGMAFDKDTTGISDVILAGSMYTFMGCPIVSASMNIGFNSSASSLSVNIVEDPNQGFYFAVPESLYPNASGLIQRGPDVSKGEPEVPSLWAFSLPKGGVGQPILYYDGDQNHLQPESFDNTRAPFYFCGLLSSYTINHINPGGKQISLTLVDPREVLNGVQVLLGGFALSQDLSGAARYTNITNVIDVFGGYDKGMTSGRNAFGMKWTDIKFALEQVRVTLFDINFEFYFTGEAFTNSPSFYRIEDETIDLIGLVQKVVDDAGADLIINPRKVSSNTCVVEFQSIKRAQDNNLTRSELLQFIADRDFIVKSADISVELRNEPTSKIVIGGKQNKNYVSYGSTAYLPFHGDYVGDKFIEDYGAWPADIKTRLYISPSGDNTLYGEVGSIFPFWGMSPSGDVPMAEPFLYLDHLAFTPTGSGLKDIRMHIPLCQIETYSPQVRARHHDQTFLEGDNAPDNRPFAYVSNYILGTRDGIGGWVRGLPLNTEICRAALVSRELFDNVFYAYYPDIAEELGNSAIDWTNLHTKMFEKGQSGSSFSPADGDAFCSNAGLTFTPQEIIDGTGTKWENRQREAEILDQVTAQIYDLVRGYADEHMGSKYIVCLPRSEIMNRIWAGQEVPTISEKPEIEYTVADAGYWEVIPTEFDGLSPSGVISDQENQIRRKFMSQDTRFYPMAVMDYVPSGNASFNSNPVNHAMFENLPSSEYRPNRIAETIPDRVYISCQVEQHVRRPDLAIVTVPPANFDPTDGYTQENIYGSSDPQDDDEYMLVRGTVAKMFKLVKAKNATAAAVLNNLNSQQLRKWIDDICDVMANSRRKSKTFTTRSDLALTDKERVMDMHSFIIPLTSNWTTYGPWYYTDSNAQRVVGFDIDDSLVPWNFPRAIYPSGWDSNLSQAANDRLAAARADMYKVTTAQITCAGLPEFGFHSPMVSGTTSNFTAIAVDFGIGGVTTTYSLSTYASKPGTYRKFDFDNISRTIVDTRPVLPDTINTNSTYIVDSLDSTARFGFQRRGVL